MEASKTRRRLASALKQLMAAQPLHSITVGDICAACHVNRKSFYYHFRDKFDLVSWIFHTEFDDAYRHSPQATSDMLLDLCQYLEQEKVFYRAALRTQGQNSFYDELSGILAPIIADRLVGRTMSPAQAAFTQRLYVSLCRESIVHWLAQNCDPSAPTFLSLLYHSVQGALPPGPLPGPHCGPGPARVSPVGRPGALPLDPTRGIAP